MEANIKNKYTLYGDIKPKDRIQELELIAFHEMTGDEVINTLRLIDEKLAEEYNILYYGDEDE